MNNYYENIEDYLAGKLSLEDKKLFELQLLSDNELKASVESQQKIIAALHQATLRNQVETNLRIVKKEKRNAIFNNNWSKAAAFLGVLSIVGIGFWMMNKPNPNDMVVVPNAKNPDTTIQNPVKIKDWEKEEPKNQDKTRNIAESPTTKEPESHVRKIEKTDKSKEEVLVEQFFKSTKVADTNNEDGKNLQKGIDLLAQKKYEDAGRVLLKIEEESPQYAESQWYLALSFLARERIDAAKSMLEEISKQSDNKYQKPAKELLEKIK